MESVLKIKNIRHSDNFIFSEHTTFGLGGAAKEAYFPKTAEEACILFNYLNDNKIKYVIIGNCSNILVSDGGYDGSVLCTSDLNSLTLNSETLYCEAGVTVGKLLNFCKKKGLSGLEYLAGIPASVGGLIYMNGGAAGSHIRDNIISVTIFDGEMRKLSLNECNFGNKHSIMRDINCIILGADLKIKYTSQDVVSKTIKQKLNERIAQPKGLSCGCVFINPDGLSAGKLIDKCGLKGQKIGGAFISPLHANFIINDGGTAADVRALILKAKKCVFEKTGIDLKEEVIYIGEFNDFNG